MNLGDYTRAPTSAAGTVAEDMDDRVLRLPHPGRLDPVVSIVDWQIGAPARRGARVRLGSAANGLNHGYIAPKNNLYWIRT